MPCCSLESTNWTCNRGQKSGPAGISLEFSIRYHLLNKDPFPPPPFHVIMTPREFRPAFALLLGKLAGPLLYYVTFKSGLTGRDLPRKLGRSVAYEALFSCKVCLSCSGLERCVSTEAVHTPCSVAKPLALKRVLGCKTLNPTGLLGCKSKTLSPKKSVGFQSPSP